MGADALQRKASKREPHFNRPHPSVRIIAAQSSCISNCPTQGNTSLAHFRRTHTQEKRWSRLPPYPAHLRDFEGLRCFFLLPEDFEAVPNTLL